MRCVSKFTFFYTGLGNFRSECFFKLQPIFSMRSSKSITLLKFMMPTVEVNVEHNHRTSGQTRHQKSKKKMSVLLSTCYFTRLLFLTFDHAIRPRTGFHYHKLGMHKVGPNWTSSKPRQYRGHLRKSGIHHLATSPNTKKKIKRNQLFASLAKSLNYYLYVIIVDFMS